MKEVHTHRRKTEEIHLATRERKMKREEKEV